MLTLNDGRDELWQWDTGRKLTVDADCSQVHFSNKIFGRSIDVDVVDGVAIIPDVLLQTDKDLFAWAFVGTAENGYTKISKKFKVNRRNKPADYVFTPPDQTSLEEIKEKIEYLESIQDPDAIKNAVEDYLEQNPPAAYTLPIATETTLGGVKAAAATEEMTQPVCITAEGKLVTVPCQNSGGNADQNGGGLNATASGLLIEILRNGVYSTDQSENITALATALSVTEPDIPDPPAEPDVPEVTLSSISATYSGGDVAVGTAVTDLTGIVVTAHYSDGTSKAVTGYTLSGTIAEGGNTITVSYGGKTTTFTVTGVAEESEGQSVTMTAWASAGDIKFNGKMYVDDGSSGETVDFGSGVTKGKVSEKTFDTDTTVKITCTNSAQTYCSFLVGSTNDDVASTMTIYHAEKFGTGGWVNPLEIEYTYIVKAGYRLTVLTSIAEVTVTVTEVA